jgi:hypothetical protein
MSRGTKLLIIHLFVSLGLGSLAVAKKSLLMRQISHYLRNGLPMLYVL